MTSGNNERLMPSIDSVLQAVAKKRPFPKFERLLYKPYNDNEALEIIEAIGKSRYGKFVIDDENRFTYLNFARWCHCDPSFRTVDPDTLCERKGDLTKGIYIAGSTGSGKSWCLDIMNTYCSAFGFRILLNEERIPLVWRTTRADTICDSWTNDGDIQEFKTQRILGIQDFGSEPKEAVYMGNKIDVMRSILEYRGDRQDLLTMFTSNLKINSQSLSDKYGDRVVSRLYSMCNYLVIKGKDRRKL